MGQTLLHLQNGSDVRGVALAKEGKAAVTLSGDIVNSIAGAFGHWLAQRTGKQTKQLRVGVGHDSRLTADMLKNEIMGGLAAVGVQCFDCGLASTPAMFMGTVFPQTAFDGAIMITASHLPKNRNGMKFFTADGGLEKADITQLLSLAEGLPAAGRAKGERTDLMTLYAAFLRQKICDMAGENALPLAGLHIVVDAGNGAGGFFVGQVLQPLGANCEGSQFLQPDGNFPNHAPNPENAEAMQAIQRAVVANKADLGIIFDTDVDRMSAVLPQGRAVNRDAIIAMMAAVLAPEFPGATIVTDSVTSDRLTDFLQDTLGLRHHCYKRGYRNVINEAIRLNKQGTLTPLAIETSGHGALKENYFLDDGAYMAVRLVAAAAIAKRENKTLEELLNGFVPAPAQCEKRIAIAAKDFATYGQTVLEVFKKRAEEQGLQIVPSYEGVRVSFGKSGWLLLRMSLHDPLLPLNVEGASHEELAQILTTTAQLLQGMDELDTSVLTA